MVTCQSCHQDILVSDVKTHAAMKCGQGGTGTAHDLCASDIVSRPLTTPPTTVEQRVASNVVRHLMSTCKAGERFICQQQDK